MEEDEHVSLRLRFFGGLGGGIAFAVIWELIASLRLLKWAMEAVSSGDGRSLTGM